MDRTKLYPDRQRAGPANSPTAKFDESIDVAVQLGVDAKKSDHRTGARRRRDAQRHRQPSASPCSPGAKAEAKAAGADIVGMDDLAAEIKAGKMDFDVVIASPGHDARRRYAGPDLARAA